MNVSSTLSRKNLVLTAMVVAVSMTFIDQTIVSIAIPQIQGDLGLTATGAQWVVNGYLLSLAALFALGGRLADTVGHRTMLVVGVVVFTVSSAMCGLAPDGDLAEPWLIGWRVVQGAGGAFLFPAALAIVVSTFALRERGKALAIFFGIAGGLTAIGPILGGYLTEWTWRAIFWVNIPVAIVALILIAVSRPESVHRPAKLDWRGALLIGVGVGLSVFGFQQANNWGWSNPATIGCIVVGLLVLVGFYVFEKGLDEPLMNVRIFEIRPFLVQNLVLFVAMLVFVPVFFFSSEYAQISLGQSASQAGNFLLHFFIGYVIAAQIGGAMLDKGGAKKPVLWGCILAAVGFYLWAGEVTSLDFDSQKTYVLLAGAGIGLMLGPASTDAINRASRLSYGEATGITQTVRNYAASLGIAILGTILVSRMNGRVTDSLVAQGMSPEQAAEEATGIAQSVSGGGSSGGGEIAQIPDFIRLDFAYATQTVLYVMAGIMVVAAVIAFVGLRSGVQPDLPVEDE